MYNPQKIIALIQEHKIRRKDLLDYLGMNYNGSVDAVIRGDIRVSKLEKIADYFGVPVDTFFDREPSNNGVSVGGVRNQVHHFTIDPGAQEIKALTSLIEEKDKRIQTLEEMIVLLKQVHSQK